MEFRQWQRKAQRAVRQSVNEIREMKMKWEDASGLGFDAATEAADSQLGLLLPQLQLGEFSKFDDLLPACEKKYKQKIDRSLNKLASACDQLSGVVLRSRQTQDVLDSVGNGEDWIVFNTLNWTTIRSILSSIHAMYEKEFETKLKLKDRFFEALNKVKEKSETELSATLEVLLRVWLLESKLDQDSITENLKMLIEECRT